MNMIDIAIALLIVGILSAAVTYIVHEKKKGVKCIGCPAGECCHMKSGDPFSGAACGNCGCDKK